MTSDELPSHLNVYVLVGKNYERGKQRKPNCFQFPVAYATFL